jgi:two-component system sensor kinase FixL
VSNSPPASAPDLSALLHELNQPLTAILSNAQAGQRYLASTPPDLGELRNIFVDIVADDKRAALLIKRIAALVKEASESPLNSHNGVK